MRPMAQLLIAAHQVENARLTSLRTRHPDGAPGRLRVERVHSSCTGESRRSNTTARR
jgi:hypothetical protein